MNVIEAMDKRYSVRSYSDRQVEQEKLDVILHAANRAPTAANRQAYKIYVLRGEKFAQFRSDVAYGAPLRLLVCNDETKVWVRKYDGKNMVDIDASIVTDHMMLAATELELGSIWITYFDPERVKSELNLPENLVPVNILAVGYSAEGAKERDNHSHGRKPVEENVVYP